MKKAKKLLAFGLVACMTAFFAVGCGDKDNGNDQADVPEDAPTYKVAMEATFPPFDTTDENGKLAGIDVDLMEAIALDQGFKLEWQTMSFGGLISALKSSNIDIVASGMWANEERAKEVDFSDVYYESGLRLAVKADSDAVNSVDDLTTDMIVGAQIGTSGADEANKLKEAGKIKEAKIYEGLDAAMLDLQNGVIQGVINDEPVTAAYMKAQPDKIKQVGDKLTKEGYGFAVKKGNTELLDKINKGLAKLKEDGKYDEILANWISE